jgi:hypothetical protein
MLTVAMLAAVLLILSGGVLSFVSTPTFRLVSSGHEPNLELSRSHHFHGFLSHVWGTGQDSTHTIVRRMQLLVAGCKIWLDVDNMDNVGELEACVADATVFLIFLSKGYFQSANCRRELYSALSCDKPIVTIREAAEDKGGASVEALKQECLDACTAQSAPADAVGLAADEVVRRVVAVEPILWARVKDFQAELLKMIAMRMLQHLPYYAKHSGELQRGLRLPGELGLVSFDKPVHLLVSSANVGAFLVGIEIREAAAPLPGGSTRVVIRDAHNALSDSGTREHATVLLVYVIRRPFWTRVTCLPMW